MDTGKNRFCDDFIAVSPRYFGFSRLDDVYRYDAHQSPAVFANAPWYQLCHPSNRGLLTEYADYSGCLHDGLSMRAVWNRDHARLIVVNPVALKTQHQPRP